MEVKIEDRGIVTLKLTLKASELENIIKGLGNASINGHMKNGMTREQATDLCSLYWELQNAS